MKHSFVGRPFLILLLLAVMSAGSSLRSGSSRAQGVSPATPDSRARHALLIGVWEYQRGVNSDREWWNLHSFRDVEQISKELKTDYGFQDDDIKTFTTRAETTGDSIRAAFKALIESTHEGDIVYFQYSGHGQQVPDTTGEELDGYNQTIVPSDYKSRLDGSNNIRNKEIRQWLHELKLRKPSSVTLVFDSCFSGDIDKDGRHLVRGEKWRGPPPTPPPGATPAAKPVAPGGILLKGEAEDLGYVVLSASMYTQRAHETDDNPKTAMGLLSYALVRALADSKARVVGVGKSDVESSTYRDLFEEVTSVMAEKDPYQTPVIDGQEDRVIFNDTTRKPQPYVLVSAKGDHLTLNAGTLLDASVGSTYALYRPDTKDFENAHEIALARVADTELGTSSLSLLPPYEELGVGSLDRSRAVEREHVYGSSGLNLYVDDGATPLPDLVHQKLQKLSAVSKLVGSNDPWNVRIHVAGGAGPPRWILERDDGSTMTVVSSTDSDLYRQIRVALENEARWRAISSLENKDNHSPIRVEFRVTPVTVTGPTNPPIKREQIAGDKPLERAPSGQIVLRNDDFVLFDVRNLGRQDAWITIIDLANDGTLRNIFPVAGCSSKNAIPADSNWHRVQWCSLARVQNPSDRIELYKLIATSEYIDLSQLVDLNSAKGAPLTSGKLSPLAELLRAATLGQKSAGTNAVNPDYWFTATIPFLVQPHK
jgi:hypothetical protein